MQCSIYPLSLEEVLGSLSSLVTVESLEFIRFIFFGGLYLPLTQELTSIMIENIVFKSLYTQVNIQHNIKNWQFMKIGI